MLNILIGLFGIIIAFFSVFLFGKISGKNAEISSSNEKVLDDVTINKNARDESASLSVDSQLDELRKDIQN